MEQLYAFIQQARQQGASDEQIRQSLWAAGWDPTLVQRALTGGSPLNPSAPLTPYPPPQPAFAQPPNTVAYTHASQSQPLSQVSPRVQIRKIPFPLLVALVLTAIIILSTGLYMVAFKKDSYQSVITQFIGAMQDNNKEKADSYVSPAMQRFVKESAGTTSFHDACVSAGQFCTPFFNTDFIHKATKKTASYTATDGTKGHKVTYTLTESLSGTGSDGQKCTSQSVNSLSLAVVPKGKTWLIDNAEPNINASGDLCLTSPGASPLVQ